jgi:glycosyltransferase involved in cell wall biosynthesis
MRFTIVTPSFKQLEWLRLCVASVRDQVNVGSEQTEDGMSQTDKQSNELLVASSDSEGDREAHFVEHIVQDAGTPGIEDFAREHGARLYRDGELVLKGRSGAASGDQDAPGGDSALLHGAHSDRQDEQEPRYSLTIYSEKDEGMYDAVNRGLRRGTGEICAYLNCDEQYLPGALSGVASWFGRNPTGEVLFGDTVVVDGSGNYICDRTAMVPTKLHTLVSGNLSMYTASTFFRRQAIVDQCLLFDREWKVIGDSVWILSLLQAGVNMKSIRRRLSSFVYSRDSLSAADLAVDERRRLRQKAGILGRSLAPIIVTTFRLKRAFSGGYRLIACPYSIYTGDDTSHRKEFTVSTPTHRWPREEPAAIHG